MEKHRSTPEKELSLLGPLTSLVEEKRKQVMAYLESSNWPIADVLKGLNPKSENTKVQTPQLG